MVFVERSLDDMLKKIKSKTLVKSEILVPNKRPDIFIPSEIDSEMIMINDDYITSLGQFARRYSSAIWELYSNAVNRGNLGDWNAPIVTKVWGGINNGSVLRIEDSGKGFLFKEYIKRFSQGEEIHQGEGLGFMRCFVEPKLFVSYEGKGNIVNIQTRLGV